jgi:hypothetical protein
MQCKSSLAIPLREIEFKLKCAGLNLCGSSAILKLLKAYPTIPASLSGQSNLAQRYL